MRSHSPGEGCSRNRCTSRWAASARSTSRRAAGRRVRLNRAMRVGQVDEVGRRAQGGAGGGQPLGGPGQVDAGAQAAPDLRLPGGVGGDVAVGPAGPLAHQLGAVERVAVKQRGQVADRGEAPRPAACRRPGGRAGPASAARRCWPRRPPAAATPRVRAATDRCSGSTPEAAATASPTSRRGLGKSTLAQTPSASDSRWVSQRSIPRVGTATTSTANGSVEGPPRSPASASTRPSARSAR